MTLYWTIEKDPIGNSFQCSCCLYSYRVYQNEMYKLIRQGKKLLNNNFQSICFSKKLIRKNHLKENRLDHDQIIEILCEGCLYGHNGSGTGICSKCGKQIEYLRPSKVL